MTEKEYTEINCPSCNSIIRFSDDVDQLLSCSVCGSEHPMNNHLCPHCLSYHLESSGNCIHCGSSLSRICFSCQTTNWSGAEYCRNCGKPTDIFVSLNVTAQQATVERLSNQMERASELKKEEEFSSKQRMAELFAIEEARQEEIRQRLSKQKQQETQLLMIVFGSVLVFLLVLIIVAIVSSLN